MEFVFPLFPYSDHALTMRDPATLPVMLDPSPFCHYVCVCSRVVCLCVVLQMVAALNGQFNDLVERLIVIDCRYPYEFEGGHIKVFCVFRQKALVLFGIAACCIIMAVFSVYVGCSVVL